MELCLEVQQTGPFWSLWLCNYPLPQSVVIRQSWTSQCRAVLIRWHRWTLDCWAVSRGDNIKWSFVGSAEWLHLTVVTYQMILRDRRTRGADYFCNCNPSISSAVRKIVSRSFPSNWAGRDHTRCASTTDHRKRNWTEAAWVMLVYFPVD